MSLAPYRRILALPGVARLLLFAVLARVPATASGVVLTLHVVTGLHRGYAAAGAVSAAGTVAMGLGGPWRGRAIDRLGLRRSLAPSVVVGTAAWAASPFVPYAGLVALTAVGGLLYLPVFSVVRQSLAALVPAPQRRTAFSLDGVGTELSFMIGPALGVLVATRASTRDAMLVLAAATLVTGLALMLLNPVMRSADPDPDPDPDPAGSRPVGPGRPGTGWFTPALAAVLAVAAGATVVLSGTDVAIVAHLREHGAAGFAGVVFGFWAAGSMVGGLVYGGARREVSPFVLLAALALLTVPVGLASGPSVLLLTILPAAALCAPVIATTAEGVSRLVPEAVRGEAMGWHASALQAGSAVGAPLAGFVMDARGAWSGFAAVGVVGAAIAALGAGAVRLRARARRPDAVGVPDALGADSWSGGHS